ncbi:MAG: FecR domain-containing protein [Chitinophagaceae bacterium]|nr:FecR domain-containing protein [Chitinophagaceae bacterium]
MNNKQDHYRTLLECYLNEDITREETERLFKYLSEHPEEITELLGPADRQRFEEKTIGNFFPGEAVSKRMLGRLLQDIKAQQDTDSTNHQHTVPVVRLLKSGWKWAAAILLLAAGTYYVWTGEFRKPPAAVSAVVQPADVEPPQSNQAFITLSGGQKIVLNGIDENNLTEQDGTKIVKAANGELAYQSEGNPATGNLVYNTLWNPRGSRVVQMQLSDGSRVWLNAGSSVTYPVRFSGKERRVSVAGEAYFEVTHNRTMPFVVSNNATNITVLGTRFNVKAYDDEETRITLLEGSVKVNVPGADRLLKPGQQAKVSKSLEVANNADVEEVMAWKNGLFKFDNADIRTIMRTVARWYDIDVVYEGETSAERFKGKISMDTRLSELLEVLELNKVAYSIENKTVKIKSVRKN